MEQDLFDQVEVIEDETPELDQTKEYLSELVGEGKKYRDPEALAKAAVHKDAFIEELKREQAELRQALQERINMEQFLDEIKAAKAKPTPSEQGTTPEKRVEQPSAVTPQDIERMLEEREAKARAKANLEAVSKKLAEVYGRNWKQEVQKRAAELEVSTAYLTEMGARSPKTLFKTLDVDAVKTGETFSAPPRTSSTPLPSSNAKNYAYWQQQRKEKGESWYFSPQTRQAIWKEVQAQGEEAFYKR